MRAIVLACLAAGCGFSGREVASDAARPVDAPPLRDAPMIDGSADAAPLMCPTTPNWVKLDGHSYYFSPDGDDKHFSAAETDCEFRGAGFSPTHLAVITTLQEAMAVGGHMVNVGQAPGGVRFAWIGTFQPLGAPSKTANWLVVTGDAAYQHWFPGEPSDGNAGPSETGKENLAQIYQDGTFNDTVATDNLHYICECDGVFANPVTLALVPLN